MSCRPLAFACILFQSTLPVWGATVVCMVKIIREGQFQSTLPVWGATEAQYQKTTEFVISIHAPRVGSDHDDEPKPPALIISIHAPRVGSDDARARFVQQYFHFNPRSPCGERRWM